MRTLRLALLLLTAFAAFPLLAQCRDCNDYFGCYVCEDTYYNAYLGCTIINNGGACMLTDPCEGINGDKCSPENPAGCEENRVDLFDVRDMQREWQLVAVKVERPRRNTRS